MYSLTLQNAAGDSVITSGDILGRMNFAVPSESDGSSSTYIASQIYSQAEGSFTSSSNPAGLVFSTSSSDSAPASGRIKLSSDGHFVPLSSGIYDLGTTAYRFRNLYANSGIFDTISFNVDNESILSKGAVSWSDTEGSLTLGLTDNTTVSVGESRYLRIRNETGGTLYKGQVVYATGVHSNGLITPDLYVADGTIREIRFMGIVLEDVNQNSNGYALDFGQIIDMDLDGSASNYAVGDETWVAGDILYVHPTGAGKLTKVEPKHSISVAIVLDTGNGNGNGRMFVRPTSYGHLDDNHDVSVSGVTNGQFLQYDSSTEDWIPSSSGNFTTLQVNGTPVPTGVGTIGFVTKWAGNNILGTGVIFDNGTNIGIGNAGQLYAKLHLRSQYTAKSSYNLLVDDSSAVATGVGGGITFGGLSSSVGTYTDFAEIKSFRETDQDNDARSSLIFSNLGSDGLLSSKMIINSSGNVGIGTASPSHKLDVSGVGRFVHSDGDCGLIVEDGGGSGIHIGDCAFISDSTYAGIKHSAHNGNLDYMLISNGGSTLLSSKDGYSTFVRAGGNDGTFQATFNDTFFGIGPNADKFLITSSKFIANNGNLNLDLQVKGENDDNALYVDANNDKVGIGTALPSEKLDVSGGIGHVGWKTFRYTDTAGPNGFSNGFAIKLNDTHDTTLNNAYHYKIRLTTNSTGSRTGATYLVWYDAANTSWTYREVSIAGSSSNNCLLAISGSNAIAYTNHPSTSYPINCVIESYFTNDADSLLYSMGSDFHWQRNVNDLYYLDGNVGIGTASPSSRLQVEGGNVVFNDNGGNYDFRVEGDADPNLLVADASSDKVGIGGYPDNGKLTIDFTNTNDNSKDAIYIENICNSTANGSYQNAGIDLLARKIVNSGVTDTGQIIGVDAIATLDGDGHLNNSYGARTWGGIYINQSGTLTNAWGIQPRVINAGKEGSLISDVRGIDILIDGDLYNRISSNGITNAKALYIRPIKDATNKYGIYQEGSSDKNYFAGNVGIGTASPSVKLDVNGNFSADSINVNDSFTFPTSDGSANQVLATDGSGNVSWIKNSNYLNINKSSLTEDTNVTYANRVAIQFDSEISKDSIYTHSTSTNSERVTVTQDGIYIIKANLGVDNTGANRAIIKMSLFKNGTEITETRCSAYSRGSIYGDEINLHLGTILELNNTNYIELYAWAEYADQANAVNTVVGECELTMLKINN